MSRLNVPATCSSILRSETKRRCSCVEDGLVRAVLLRVPSEPGSGWAEEEARRVKVNFTFENVEGQDEVSSEASAFQPEEVELAKPFLIWHVTKISH